MEYIFFLFYFYINMVQDFFSDQCLFFFLTRCPAMKQAIQLDLSFRSHAQRLKVIKKYLHYITLN